MYDSFSRVVHRFGRVTEPLVMAWYGLSRPLEALGQAGLGLKLLVRGRLDILPQKIKMPETIRRLLAEEDR
jgi:hypothetical protein